MAAFVSDGGEGRQDKEVVLVSKWEIVSEL